MLRPVSNILLYIDGDSEEAYFGDGERFNDLVIATGSNASGDAGSPEQHLVATNQLLGIIVAILILYIIWGLIKFFYRLITNNITNHF